MNEFELHSQIKKDSLFVRDLPLSQLRLNNQETVPWLLLIPKRSSIREIYELSQSDRIQLMEEITQTSNALVELFQPDKINVGALGNLVPQLHIHVIARFARDEAWPSPVWGQLSVKTYSPESSGAIIVKLNALTLWSGFQT